MSPGRLGFARPGDRSFDRFEADPKARFIEDLHVRATVLFKEVVALGFDRPYYSTVEGTTIPAPRPKPARCLTFAQPRSANAHRRRCRRTGVSCSTGDPALSPCRPWHAHTSGC